MKKLPKNFGKIKDITIGEVGYISYPSIVQKFAVVYQDAKGTVTYTFDTKKDADRMYKELKKL